MLVGGDDVGTGATVVLVVLVMEGIGSQFRGGQAWRFGFGVGFVGRVGGGEAGDAGGSGGGGGERVGV